MDAVMRVIDNSGVYQFYLAGIVMKMSAFGAALFSSVAAQRASAAHNAAFSICHPVGW
jgi:hypothetical protein